MDDQFRNTGKFRPYQEMIYHNYTTNSVIKVPSPPHNTKLLKILWGRRCGQFNQKLSFFDENLQYVCSQLDKDCLIESFVQYELANGTVLHKFYVFGPIALQHEYNFLVQQISSSEQQIFEVLIIGHEKNYNCIVILHGSTMIIRNKTNQSGSQHIVCLSDIVNSYVRKTNNSPTLIVPIYFRVIPLKLFRQIVSEGNYAQQNDPVVIKVIQPTQPKFGAFHNVNYKWKKFLLKINQMKQDSSHRENPNVISNNKIVISRNVEHPRYSEQANPNINSKSKQKNTTMKKSENYERNNNNKKIQEPVPIPDSSLKNSQVNYTSQFENLFEQPQTQQLALELSFQQQKKKANTQQEKKLLQKIKQKKKQRDEKNKVNQLKQRLKHLLNYRETLLVVLQKERRETEKIQKKQKHYGMINYGSLNFLKMQIQQLRIQYEQCLQQSGKRKQEQRFSLGI